MACRSTRRSVCCCLLRCSVWLRGPVTGDQLHMQELLLSLVSIIIYSQPQLVYQQSLWCYVAMCVSVAEVPLEDLCSSSPDLWGPILKVSRLDIFDSNIFPQSVHQWNVVSFEIWNFIMVVFAIHNDKWPAAVCIDAANRFYLMLCDVINYNGVISAPDSYKSVKNVHFTNVWIVENIVV